MYLYLPRTGVELNVGVGEKILQLYPSDRSGLELIKSLLWCEASDGSGSLVVTHGGVVVAAQLERTTSRTGGSSTSRSVCM